MAVEEAEVGKVWTLYILGQLAESWPRRVSFNAMDLSTKTGVEPMLESDLDETFFGTLDWLRNEGFVRYQDNMMGEGWVEDVQITAKAMDAIGHALPTYKGQVGKHLKTIAAGAGSAAGQAAISETMGLVVGAAARAFLGGGAS
jgi:hypothetical protein